MDVKKEVILKLDNLTKNFGGLIAVNKVSLEIKRGLINGLIGPNGSGKTTLINTITGIYKASAGKVFFANRNINGLKPNIISKFGIARTFQIPKIFSKMTVLENLLAVAPKEGIKENREKGMQLLEQVGLENDYNKISSSLSYGQWKLLELVRAVMTEPTLIFLDEPTPGVTLKLVEKTIDFIHTLNNKSITFVVVEHNMKVMMSLCEKIFVLEHGRKISEGTPKEIQNDPEVIRAYLGEDNYT